MSPLAILLLLALGLGLYGWGRWRRQTDPRQRRRQGIALGLLLLGVLLIVMAATGRLHWLFALLGGVLPFLQRALIAADTYRQWRARRQAQDGGAQAGGGGERGQAGGARGGLTAEQARAILGVGADASAEEIIAAHRRLMQKLHPDRGGNHYLASQLNSAKRVLLGE